MSNASDAPSAPELMTRSQFAAHIDCAKSYVTKLGNQGRLVLADDGRVRVAETLALIRATTGAPERASEIILSTPAAPAPADEEHRPLYIDWKDRKERAQAEMAEMDVMQRRGQLLEADQVRAVVVSAATQLRTRLEMLPDQLAPVLAASSDEQHIRAQLAQHIEAALADLAHEFGKAA